MDETPITRHEYDEYKSRVKEENDRQNKRIGILEENSKQLVSLTVSVEKLAQSIEHMVKEQEQQGTRLQQLEDRDGEMWRKVVGYAATVIVGAVIGYIFSQVGL